MAKTRFLYFGNQYIGEADETNTVTKRYVNEPGRYTDLIGAHEEATSNDLFYHYDATGSTRSVTDVNGIVTDTFEYDAWGNIISISGANDIHFLYIGMSGYYYDDSINTYYVMSRSYDPSLSRWLSTDPITKISLFSISREFVLKYLYAINRPSMKIDPSGLVEEDNDEKKKCAKCEELKGIMLSPTTFGPIQERIACLMSRGCKPLLHCVCCGDNTRSSACMWPDENNSIHITMCCESVGKFGFSDNFEHELIHAIRFCGDKGLYTRPGAASCETCLKEELTAYACAQNYRTLEDLIKFALGIMGGFKGSCWSDAKDQDELNNPKRDPAAPARSTGCGQAPGFKLSSTIAPAKCTKADRDLLESGNYINDFYQWIKDNFIKGKGSDVCEGLSGKDCKPAKVPDLPRPKRD